MPQAKQIEIPFDWACPACNHEQTDTVPQLGPCVTCGKCGRSFCDEQLSDVDSENWEMARQQADAAALIQQNKCMRDKLIHTLKMQIPVKGCHAGRGIPHSEACFHTCFDTWDRLVTDICQTCGWNKQDVMKEIGLHWVNAR